MLRVHLSEISSGLPSEKHRDNGGEAQPDVDMIRAGDFRGCDPWCGDIL